MVAKIQILRSITPAARPSGKSYGEPYVNLADNQFGVFDSSNVSRDLLGVPIFSSAISYAAGTCVSSGATLWIAKAGGVPAGAWDPTKWIPLSTAAASPQLNLQNGIIVESHASGAATFALKTNIGNDPSTSSPVSWIDSVGTYHYITGPLSITIPSGATLGFNTGGVAGRLWLAIIDDAGTPRLIVRNCLARWSGAAAPIAGTGIAGFGEDGALTATAISSSANSTQTNYSNATVSTARQSKIIARADYLSGLTTAGTWNVSPALFMLGSSSALPGRFIKSVEFYVAGMTTTSSTFQTSNLALNFGMGNPCNMVRFSTDGDLYIGASGASCVIQAFRDAVPIAGTRQLYGIGPSSFISPFAMAINDAPGDATGHVFAIKFKNADNTTTVGCPQDGGRIECSEIMA